jgi:hypothetical protein
MLCLGAYLHLSAPFFKRLDEKGVGFFILSSVEVENTNVHLELIPRYTHAHCSMKAVLLTLFGMKVGRADLPMPFHSTANCGHIIC